MHPGNTSEGQIKITTENKEGQPPPPAFAPPPNPQKPQEIVLPSAPSMNQFRKFPAAPPAQPYAPPAQPYVPPVQHSVRPAQLYVPPAPPAQIYAIGRPQHPPPVYYQPSGYDQAPGFQPGAAPPVPHVHAPVERQRMENGDLQSIRSLTFRAGIVECPFCHEIVTTDVHKVSGNGFWLSVMLLSLCGLCWMPFACKCIFDCKDHNHRCPKCRKKIKVWRRVRC